MKKSVKTLIWGLLAIVLTMALGMIDTKVIAETGTEVGFATFNQVVWEFFGVNAIWDTVADVLMWTLVVLAAVAGAWSLMRWAKDDKDSAKIGRGIVGFAGASALMVGVHWFFDNIWIINYRPVLVDGLKEASFPSAHSLVAVVLGISVAMLFCQLVKNRTVKIIINTVLPTMMVCILVARVMSGMHWTTDVAGSLCYGMVIVSAYQWWMEARHE